MEEIDKLSDILRNNYTLNTLKYIHKLIHEKYSDKPNDEIDRIELIVLRKTIYDIFKEDENVTYNSLKLDYCLFDSNKFIKFVTTYPRSDLKMILGATNIDNVEYNIFDKTRFENNFDFVMTNENIGRCNNLKVLKLDFGEFKSLSLIEFTRNDENNIVFSTEKFEKIVVDWSVIKFIPIKLLILLFVLYIKPTGSLFFEISTFSEKYVINNYTKYYINENNELDIRPEYFGREYMNNGVFDKNNKILSMKKITENNYLFLKNKLDTICPDNYKIEIFYDDDNYPNEPIQNKKVNNYFKITKLQNVKMAKEFIRNFNIYIRM